MSFTVEEDTSTNVVEDFLSVDQPVPGQNFTCLSFVSPEKVLLNKQLYMVKAFLRDLFDKKEVDAKYNEDEREVLKKMRQDKFEHLFDSDFEYRTIDDLFENYRVTNEEPVFKKFDEENNFQTSVRGLKVRGTYDTRREAEVRAEVLRRKDPNFNVFVGQVGYWLPWDPEPHQIDEQIDQEQQLNELVKRYKENKERVDEEFQQRKEESLKAAREENERRKAENERKKTEKEVVELTNEDNVELVEDPAVVDLRDEEELPELDEPSEPSVSTNTGGVDTEEEAQRKISELRETLKHKDSGYATLMGQPDPWLSRKQEREEKDKEQEQVMSPEDTAKELNNIAANIF
jgi:hypothetical protein